MYEQNWHMLNMVHLLFYVCFYFCFNYRLRFYSISVNKSCSGVFYWCVCSAFNNFVYLIRCFIYVHESHSTWLTISQFQTIHNKLDKTNMQQQSERESR